MEPDEVVLAPDRVLAGIWTGFGGLATGLATYAFASSSQLAVLYGTLVLLCAGVTGAHLIQLLAPASWTLHLDDHRLHGHVATVEVDVDLASLRAIELGRTFGDRSLVLLGAEGRRVLLLPVGCDTAALQRRLAALERAASRVSTPRPTDTQPIPSADGDA